jgi:ATPase subunit of ABC transporter with duplicated ATPase domains
MSIIVKNISYIHPDKEILFENISFSLVKGQKVALIGNNGFGKSTIIKLINGDLENKRGEISTAGIIYCVPQHFGQFDNQSVAEALRIDEKIEALHSILAGNTSIENFMILSDDWTIEERVKNAFTMWNIAHIELSRQMKSLSGGEKTKVFLSGINIYSPDIILLDEPTNHLDSENREKLYAFIENFKGIILAVSHDRSMLNLLNTIYELNKSSINVYGGNYEFYKMEKEKYEKALQKQLLEKEKELRLNRKIAQETAERKQKHEIRGKKNNFKKGIPRIVQKGLKDNAEKSSNRIKNEHINKTENISKNLFDIRAKLSENKELKLNVENTNLHEGKILIKAKNINFKYSGNSFLWKLPLSFQIISGDRIVISGKNGIGKTTLLHLMLGKLVPTEGELNISTFSHLYIDQQYSIINNHLSILEQAETFNKRNLHEHEIKTILHRFLFPVTDCGKLCKNLSGGEKMRLVFCCLIIENNVPDMFILDEPANNLDIQSLNIITSVLKSYKGTMLVISHDKYFIEEIAINKKINL